MMVPWAGIIIWDIMHILAIQSKITLPAHAWFVKHTIILNRFATSSLANESSLLD